MTFGPSVSRPVQWIGWAGLVTMLLLVGLLAACAQEQPVPEPQQPAPAQSPPTAVPIDASPQTSRVAPLPAPTASLPPPTVAPTSMPSTQVPTPRPTRAPAITEATPSPTPEPPSAVSTQPAQTQQDQGTIQPAVSSVAIVWGDLFNELSSTEQDCLMTELGENQLSEIRAQPISPEEPQWAPAVFACLTPDTAIALSGAMLFALMVNEVLLGDAGGDSSGGQGVHRDPACRYGHGGNHRCRAPGSDIGPNAQPGGHGVRSGHREVCSNPHRRAAAHGNARTILRRTPCTSHRGYSLAV